MAAMQIAFTRRLNCSLTSKQVISTGMTVPTLSCVAALYSLQNCIMLRPCTTHPLIVRGHTVWSAIPEI